MSSLRLILGGTFNPPHYGHTLPALNVADRLGADAVALMPSRIPPHKHAVHCNTEHRVRMVELMCETDPRLYAELVELDLPSPSYTVNTLAYLKQKTPQQTLIFLMGEDSLYQFDHWYQWQNILNYCHLVVMSRSPGGAEKSPVVLSSSLASWLEERCISDPSLLTQVTCGNIWFSGTPFYSISSTELRQWLENNGAESQVLLRKWLAPQVLSYIQNKHIYQP